MQRPFRAEDDESQLAQWVGRVTARWAARRDLSAAQRRALFSSLLGALARARTRTGTTSPLTASDPGTYADTTAQEAVVRFRRGSGPGASTPA